MEFPSFNWPNITFKPGPGVIGRTAPVAIAAEAAIFGMAWIIPVTEVRIVLAVGALVLPAFYFILAFRHADKNPSTAVTEGLHALRMYQQQTLAAKGFEIDALPSEVKKISQPPAQLVKTDNDGDLGG